MVIIIIMTQPFFSIEYHMEAAYDISSRRAKLGYKKGSASATSPTTPAAVSTWRFASARHIAST